MSQYCFNFDNPNNERIDEEGLKLFIQNLYVKDKSKDSFKDVDVEDLPFGVIYAKKDNSVCIVLTVTGKKNIERIEAINTRLKPSQLKFGSLTLSKPYQFDVEAQEWWGDKKPDTSGKRWDSLRHSGPYFSYIMEPYEPLGAYLTYEGIRYPLSPEEEKVATLYAKFIIRDAKGDVVKLRTHDPVFNRNFWNDFREQYLSPEHKKIFKDLKKVGWEDLVSKVEARTDEKKARESTKAGKREKKIRAAEKKRNYGYAYIDGHREKVGNYTPEPAGLFEGVGDNPKRGKIKREVRPEDVTINIGPNDSVPDPPEGYEWGSVINNQTVVWLASWKDSITGDNKYILFSAEGRFKGETDFIKYEKARKLEKHINVVRAKYMEDAESSDMIKKQLGTVLFLIDNYGIRVGGEKSEDEADTVGASTLRVGHVDLIPPNRVIFDFLGKDSVRFHKELEVPPIIYDNFQTFLEGKDGTEDVFDQINCRTINTYLKEFDKEFSAKVFRTRLASVIMYRALKSVNVPKNSTKTKTKTLFNKANAQVAEVLNHTRNISKKAKDAIKKDKEKLKEKKKEKKEKEKEGKSTKTIVKSIESLKNRIEQKSDVMAVAIATSLNNYIDPRLVISWAEKQEVDLTAIYSSTLMKKFQWANYTTDEKWDYLKTPLVGNPDLEPIEESEKDVEKYPCKQQSSKKRSTRRKSIKKQKKTPDRRSTMKYYDQQHIKFSFGPHIIPTDHNILKNFCSDPYDIYNTAKLIHLTPEVFDWVNQASEYAIANKTVLNLTNIQNHINNMIIKSYKINQR